MTANAVRFPKAPPGAFAALDAIEPRVAGSKSGRTNGAGRFFVKAGETKRMIFLTDDPPIIEEHTLKLDGKCEHHFTCLKNLGETCPLCEAGDPPATVGFFAVIDRSAYTTTDGIEAKDRVVVLAAKFGSLKLFKKFSRKYQGLVGSEFEVDRTTGWESKIGDSYTRELRHTTAELEVMLGGQEVSAVVPDWEQYLAPQSPDALEAVLKTKGRRRRAT